MDFSEIYIKMCEKAEKIQDYFTTPLPPGTFWARQSEGYYSEGVTGWNYKRLPEWTILPRQDQLQEMGNFTLDSFYDFWLRNGGKDEYIGIISMEQLWLAFVMEEKWGKIWSVDKEDWIKQEVTVEHKIFSR